MSAAQKPPASRAIEVREALVITEAIAIAPKIAATAALLESVKNLRVLWQCPCGCPTLHFVPNSVARSGNSQVVADAVGLSLGGRVVGLLLWGNDVELHTLEAYSLSSDRHAELPRADSIRPFTGGTLFGSTSA